MLTRSGSSFELDSGSGLTGTVAQSLDAVQDLQTGLVRQPEEKRHTSIVAMGASTDIERRVMLKGFRKRWILVKLGMCGLAR